MPGSLNSPYRFDPFDQSGPYGGLQPEWNGDDETHTAATQQNGRVGFFTFEAPQLRIPSETVLTRVEDSATMAEVARLTSPGPDQYRVDYDADGFFGTGFVEVHASQVGKQFRIGYYGLGTSPRWETRLNAALDVADDSAIAGAVEIGENLTADGDADLQGNVSLAENVGATITANGKRIQNVGTAVEATDGLSKGQAPDFFEQHGVEILTGSGNWTRPRGVRKVFVIAIGPGGNGASSVSGGGGGGGGGGSFCSVVDLDSLGAGPFAYVIPSAGSVGTPTTIFGGMASHGSAATTATGGNGGGASVPGVGTGRTGAAGASGSGGGLGGGGGGAAGGLGGLPSAGSGGTGGQGGGFFAGNGGAGSTGNGSNGASYGGGGGGGGSSGTGGQGGAGFIMLIY